MKKITALSLTAAFVLGLSGVAQAQSPQVPTIANISPANPVATDGSPLPRSNAIGPNAGLLTGRSAFAPVGTIVGAGVDTAGAIVGVGVDTAGAVVGGVAQSTGTLLGR